ncbi:unnamed protein product, partial [Ilex paraguariensis]
MEQLWEYGKSLWWWCMMVLGLGALLYLMARTKKTGRVSPPPSSTSQKRTREGPSPEDKEERRTKARHDAKRQWIEENGLTCGRYVENTSLGHSNEV